MTVIDYESIEEVSLDTAGWEYSWASTIPWVNSPMIDASTSVSNIPEPDVILEWTLNVVRGWTNTVNFSSVNENTVDWSEWSLTMPDWTVYTIAAGTTWIMTAITYIYLDVNESETTLQLTTTSWDSVGEDKLLVCVAKNQDAPKYAVYQNFWTNTQDVFITADNIAANSITANEMQVNSLSALSANMWSLTSWTITLDSAWHIKSWQTNYNVWTWFFLWVSWWVPKFSLGNPSGNYIKFDWTNLTLNVPISYNDISDTPTIPEPVELPSYIKSTYIDSVSITSPTITGWTLQTGTNWQRVVIDNSNSIKFYNSSNTLVGWLYWTNTLWTGVIYSSWPMAMWWVFLSQAIRPISDSNYNLWETALQWRYIYVKNDLVIDWYALDESSWNLRWKWSYVPYVEATASWTTVANSTIRVKIWWTSYTINARAI